MTSKEELDATWLIPFTTLQRRYEMRIRTVLLSASQDAEKAVLALSKKQTFSSGVRIAQIRLLIEELQPILKELFNDAIPVIANGQQDAGVLAVNKFSETDADYLAKAFSQSGSVRDFVDGQRQSARVGIRQAISSITRSDYDLSSNVYTTRALANRWLKNQVTGLVLRGESAQTIARVVRASIRPNTPGGVAYAALRLGRTELNNAFHATAVDLAKDRPWVTGINWNLSSVHSHTSDKKEICEQYAEMTWTPKTVRPKPHPQCRCYVTPALVPYEQFVQNLTAGKYRSWIREAA